MLGTAPGVLGPAARGAFRPVRHARALRALALSLRERRPGLLAR